MNKLLVTGSSGLIGSECAAYFDSIGWEVHGVDNNMRRDFFGADGDTTPNLNRLQSSTRNFHHYALDIRDRPAMLELVAAILPDFVIHAAARPFDDFDVNAVGTMNVLEAVHCHCPDAVFAHLSTNKVYGDAPNEIKLKELPTRWDYDDPAFQNGIPEDFRIDRCKHSIFGASKVAADIMVQEYGRYYGMKTSCFRGGCLTGPAHAAAEPHGFLAYLVRCCHEGRRYRIYGYKGKQVRDNIHARDVSLLMEAFFYQSRPGEVYNLGGGRENSVSILEAIELAESATGKKLDYEYMDQNRSGDHICYISDLRKLKSHFPGWKVTRSLADIFQELAEVRHGKV